MCDICSTSDMVPTGNVRCVLYLAWCLQSVRVFLSGMVPTVSTCVVYQAWCLQSVRVLYIRHGAYSQYVCFYLAWCLQSVRVLYTRHGAYSQYVCCIPGMVPTVSYDVCGISDMVPIRSACVHIRHGAYSQCMCSYQAWCLFAVHVFISGMVPTVSYDVCGISGMVPIDSYDVCGISGMVPTVSYDVWYTRHGAYRQL